MSSYWSRNVYVFFADKSTKPVLLDIDQTVQTMLGVKPARELKEGDLVWIGDKFELITSTSLTRKDLPETQKTKDMVYDVIKDPAFMPKNWRK
jgi:hypothetical protein